VESARQSPAIQGPVAKGDALPENPAFEQPLFVIKSTMSSMVPSTPCSPSTVWGAGLPDQVTIANPLHPSRWRPCASRMPEVD
jgi:hypothetical protein